VAIGRDTRRGGFGLKKQNLSHRGLDFVNAAREPLYWVEGTYLEWGKLGFKCWEVKIDLCVRVGEFGPKCKNQAIGARISQMHYGRALNWVEGTYLGWSKLGLKGQEVGIDLYAKVGGCGPKTENQATGAWFWLTQC
jgi:hypothetical protein